MPPRPAGHRAFAACGLLATLVLLLAAGPAQAKYGFVGKWGGPGSGKGQFAFPYGIDTDAAGDVYIADTDNHRIQKFSANGHFLAKWGRKGSRNGQFNNPTGVTTDAAANVYVIDARNGRIQKFRAVKGSGGKRTVKTIPVRGGRAFFEVSCTLSMPCRAMVEIKVGKQTLAKGRYSVGAGRTRRVSLRLTRAGRKALRRKGRVRAKATIADSRTGKRKTIPVVLRKR